MASLPIPDELLPEIFVRLPTPADLVRASATCVSFRRVVADRSFLRRRWPEDTSSSFIGSRGE